MKIFKIILNILIVIIIVMSITLNILCFGSSYGTLSIKYNENKFIAMNDYAFNTIDSFILNQDSKTGLQIEATNVNDCKVFSSNYYFDKESKLSFKISCIKESHVENIYFSNDILYLDNVNNNGEKTKVNTPVEIALTKYSPNVDEIYLIGDIIKNNQTKTKLQFSFSPFYVLGINYQYKDLSKTKYSYSYDFNGHLRKVRVINNEKQSDYTIGYKSKTIALPDLSSYN